MRKTGGGGGGVKGACDWTASIAEPPWCYVQARIQLLRQQGQAKSSNSPMPPAAAHLHVLSCAESPNMFAVLRSPNMLCW
jgi:hypothetical protein